jgi:uncharacterized protein DUF4136
MALRFARMGSESVPRHDLRAIFAPEREMNFRSLTVLAFLGPLVVLVGCSTLRVGNDFDRSASFSGYHRFTWIERDHHGSANPLVAQRAREAIEQELLAKGFQHVATDDTADFAVDFTIGSVERTEVTSYPPPYAGRWWDLNDWWGHPYWAYGVDVHEYREGTLSVDIFDVHSHAPVWHGWAKKELTRSDIKHSQGPIRTAVHQILLEFPPAR